MLKKFIAYFAIFASLTLTGCKLVTEVGEGGQLDSLSGVYNCNQFATCTIDITAADFDETFTAVPKGGYVFSHWKGGKNYNCAGSENPVCQVANTSLAGNAGAESAIASNAEYYIEPVFRALRVPSAVFVDDSGKVVGVPVGWNPEPVLLPFFDGFSTTGVLELAPFNTALKGGQSLYDDSSCGQAGGSAYLSANANYTQTQPLYLLGETINGGYNVPVQNASITSVLYNSYVTTSGVCVTATGSSRGIPAVYAGDPGIVMPLRVEFR